MTQVQGFGGTGPCSSLQAWFTTRKAASTTIFVRFWWIGTLDFSFIENRFPLAKELLARLDHLMTDPKMKTSRSFLVSVLV